MSRLRALTIAGVLLTTLGASTSYGQSLSVDEARAIAKEAYIYGFPLVDNYRVQYSYFVDEGNPEFKAPWNQLNNTARVYTPDDKAIQTPNSDTPYSQLGADLRSEPLVLTLPKVEDGRYFSAQFVDQYTFNFAYLGSRTSGNGGGNYLLAGPDWKGETPPGIKGVIRSQTQFAFVFYRTQLFNPADIDNVKKVQAGYKVQPLSAFLGKPAPATTAVDFIKPLSPDQELSSLEFFNVLNFVLKFCPTHPDEQALMQRLAKLGIGPGQSFNVDSLSPELRQAIADGMADAWSKDFAEFEKLRNARKVTSRDVFGTREHLHNNYLYRMAGAVSGIYGNSEDEALYPSYYVDGAGKPLDAAQHRYVLRFAPGQLPPVNAFWSLTPYNLPARMLIANPLNRYLINSAMLPDLKRDPDGGLTFYVQPQSPGKDKEANWLPTPNGPFIIAMRMYWPKPEALSGQWQRPELQQVN
ncbi:DUF1254 domain-containing protein [Pseudomonas putida]|uniref:DUF1254 domain-containing protein n=1 Tax=Pseudomonas putida TaxID=303 RepID=A0A2Z4RDJ5_PSEPU|nr:DUF1254 domain-containing protein [Pseudomonas putida]AWY39200.1 DUF1254 domain-containing protein [Pseudomonas putida]